MKNDVLKITMAALSSAVLASLLTLAIFQGLVPVQSGIDSPAPTNPSAFEQLSSQVEALLSGSHSSATVPTGGILTTSRAQAYLDKALSSEYVSHQVVVANGTTSLSLPYANSVVIDELSFTNTNLGLYNKLSAHPWDSAAFNLWFSKSSGDSDSSYVTGIPPGGFGLYVQSGTVNELPKPAECAGEYPETVKQVAGFFLETFWNPDTQYTGANVRPVNPCEFIAVSEPVMQANNNIFTNTSLAPNSVSAVRAYTFTYDINPYYDIEDGAWPDTMHGFPVLPTVFIRDPELTTDADTHGVYTYAVWLKKYCYAVVGRGECPQEDPETDVVQGVIEKLSSDLTTRTVILRSCGYGECY